MAATAMRITEVLVQPRSPSGFGDVIEINQCCCANPGVVYSRAKRPVYENEKCISTWTSQNRVHRSMWSGYRNPTGADPTASPERNRHSPHAS